LPLARAADGIVETSTAIRPLQRCDGISRREFAGFGRDFGAVHRHGDLAELKHFNRKSNGSGRCPRQGNVLKPGPCRKRKNNIHRWLNRFFWLSQNPHCNFRIANFGLIPGLFPLPWRDLNQTFIWN
jgi:hypothetical protein